MVVKKKAVAASEEPQTLGISIATSGSGITWSSFPADTITVSLWVKRNGNGSTSQESIFDYSNTGSSAYRALLSHDATNYEYYHKAYTYTDFAYQPASAGDWMFVAFTFDYNGTDSSPLKYYIGRVGDVTLTEVSQTQYGMGGANAANDMNLCNDAWNKWFNGEFAYLRIWNTVLTKTQLEAEMDSATPIVTSNIWFANDLNGTSGCNTDESGAGHNGTTSGTITDGGGGPF